MADNITLSTNIGTGSVIATDDISSTHYQIIKLTFGALDAQTIASSGAGNVDAGSQRVVLASDQAVVSTNWAGTSPPIGAGTEATALRVTLATDSTGVITVDNGGTFATQATLQANSGVDIGDVDVTSLTPGTAAANLGKAEDAVHSSGDAGVMALSVRQNTAAATSGADGDYQPLITDTNGRLHVNDVSTAAALSGSEFQVDVVAALPAGTNAIGTLAANSGVDIGDVDVTSIIPGTAATNLGKAVDSASGATDTGVPSLVLRDDTLTTLTPIDGDYTHLRVSSTGALHVTGGGGGTEYTEDVATANPIVGTASLMERDDALATLTPIEGDWAGMRCSATGALWTAIDGTVTVGSHAVTNAGTFATQATLQSNTGVDIGDVDVTSIIPGTGATNLGKAIDSAGGGTDTGVPALAIRDDSLTTLTPVDGDYVGLRVNSTGALHVTGGGGGTEYVVNAAAPADPTGTASLMERDDALSALTEIEGDWSNMRCDANGALWTVVNGTVTVDLAGNNDVTIDSSSIVLAEDAVHSSGDAGVMSLAVRNDTLATLVGTDGDYAPLQVNASGALFIQEGAALDVSAATVTVDGSAVTQPVSGTVTANAGTGTMTVDLGANNDVTIAAAAAAIAKAEDVASAGGDVGVPAMARRTATPADTSGADLDYEMLQMDNGRLWASATVTNTVTVDGSAVTQPVSGTVTANAGTGTMTVDLAGNNDVTVTSPNAHDGTTLANPVLTGARATNSVEGVTQVANADLTYLQADLNGVLLTRNGTTLEEILTERISNTNGTSTDFVTFAAGGSGVNNYITEIAITNMHATTNAYVDFRDGAAGSIVWTMPAPAVGGSVLHFDPPLKFADNTAVAYDVSAAVTTVYISVKGYQAQG